MPARTIHDTISDTTGRRERVEVDSDKRRSIQYSNGVELIVEKTGDGVPGVMKEVREITRVKTPHKMFVGGFGPGKWKSQEVNSKATKEGTNG